MIQPCPRCGACPACGAPAPAPYPFWRPAPAWPPYVPYIGDPPPNWPGTFTISTGTSYRIQ